MSRKSFRISKEIKDQVVGRIKDEGVSVLEASKDHGVSPNTIYKWLGTKASSTVSLIEHRKLLKENKELKEIIGELTIKMSVLAKKGL